MGPYFTCSIKADVDAGRYVEDIKHREAGVSDYECHLRLTHRCKSTGKTNLTDMLILTTDKPSSAHLAERLRAVLGCYDGVTSEGREIALAAADVWIVGTAEGYVEALFEQNIITEGDNVRINPTGREAFSIC